MTTAQTSKSWVICSQPNSRAKLRLFCFHYAGGGASNFRFYSDKLPSSIEVCSIELPGRGFRLKETAFTSLDRLVQAIADTLLPLLDKPFAFFGYSMGSVQFLSLTRY